MHAATDKTDTSGGGNRDMLRIADEHMKDHIMDLERRMKSVTHDLIESGKRENMIKIDSKVSKFDDNVQKYYKRMNQLDIKATNTLMDVQNSNERFQKKIEEVTDRWMSAMGKEEKVRI